MKIFLDDFTIFSDLSTHLEKFNKCFLRGQEFGISLNLNKCAFMVFSKTILGFIMFRGKIMDPKKVEALANMLVPITPQEIQVFNGMAQFNRCFIKNFASIMSLVTKFFKNLKFLSAKMLRKRLKIGMYKPLLRSIQTRSLNFMFISMHLI
jgi:hypothetical protein